MTNLIPALDLIDSKVVRLFKGDYAKKQSYLFDPLEKFKEYEALGAKYLHLVDLSGAKDTSKRQIDLIKFLAQNVKTHLQVGGGIRTKNEIDSLLKIGIKRVVIGSLAITNPALCIELLKEFGAENLVFALDVKDEKIAINAWQQISEKSLFEVIEQYAPYGLKHILCTDISKDGTMTGANVNLYKKIKSTFPNILVQASGGVSNLEDIKNLKNNCDGIIVGKALLDGIFSIPQALEILK